METGRVSGILLEDLIEFYLGGREEKTLSNYNGAFQYVWAYGSEIRRSLFFWGEGELASLMVRISRDKKGENFLKKCSAVVTLLLELAGFDSLVGGSVLKMVKKSAIKKMNANKERKVRRGATLEDISKMIREIFIKKKH